MTAAQRRFCPALLVAAPASGQGKTTVAAALARLHARQGRQVRVFKCGADFLDPGWLALASGAPVHSLDLWMTGEADCAARLWQAAGEADLLIVEGVMGLFDGDPSAADLARRFALPVLAVVDASAMAGTFGALAFGLQRYRDGLPWAGVLANRVAGEGHAAMLRESLRDSRHWLGALPRDPAFVLPERHLGLVAATESTDGLARIDAMADALAETPLGRMTASELLGWSVQFDPPAAQPALSTAASAPTAAATPLRGKTVAVARDTAFCFIYPANLDCLLELGAQLVFFSPLADPQLPHCDAVWLPGGYPELHAGRLADATRFMAGLRSFAETRAVHGECGGYMALGRALTDAQGVAHEMAGLLSVETSFFKRRMTLGYRRARLLADGPLGPQGAVRLGHEFHYATITAAGDDVALAQVGDAYGGAEAPSGSRRGRVSGSFFHVIAEAP